MQTMLKESYSTISKSNWGNPEWDGKYPGHEAIIAGSLQRIATQLEDNEKSEQWKQEQWKENFDRLIRFFDRQEQARIKKAEHVRDVQYLVRTTDRLRQDNMYKGLIGVISNSVITASVIISFAIIVSAFLT
jgi:hypothetical protein